MKYLDLKTKLAEFIVFSPADIKNFDPHFDSRRLNEWQLKGYIQKIRRGFYRFSDSSLSDQNLYLIANKIYSPSYISLEIALSYYHLIPESVYAITSVSSAKTATFNSPVGTFSYRHLKPSLIFGTRLISWQNRHLVIGEPEKVILDYFYLNSQFDNQDKLAGLRLNSDSINTQIDWKKLDLYLKKFQNRALDKRLAIIKEIYA